MGNTSVILAVLLVVLVVYLVSNRAQPAQTKEVNVVAQHETGMVKGMVKGMVQDSLVTTGVGPPIGL